MSEGFLGVFDGSWICKRDGSFRCGSRHRARMAAEQQEAVRCRRRSDHGDSRDARGIAAGCGTAVRGGGIRENRIR